MSFEDVEESRYHGRPDTLYKFTFDTNVYAYTDAEKAITFSAVEYEPIPIERDAVTSSGTLDKTALGIRVPHDSAIAELFRVFPPSEVVGVTVFQGHSEDEDSEFLTVYSGRVISCARDGSVATLRCEPINTAMKRPGLRMRYQHGCPHALYGTACGAAKEDFSFTHTVVSVDDGRVTLGEGWAGSYAASKYANGVMTWTHDGRTEIRLIKSASSLTNRLFIAGTVEGLSIGAEVTITLGCNHQMTDCEMLFNNVQNFGGCPWIPLKNPVGMVNRYW